MKEITKEDLLENRFIKYSNKEKTRFYVIQPSREKAEKMLKHTLCIFIGVDSLRKRDINGAVKNANYFLKTKTKEDILNLWWPKEEVSILNKVF